MYKFSKTAFYFLKIIIAIIIINVNANNMKFAQEKPEQLKAQKMKNKFIDY